MHLRHRVRRWFPPRIGERRLASIAATGGLLGALAGAAILTVQAYAADDARREATGRGLEHLASVAAWEFARQATSELVHGARMALWTASTAPGPMMDHAKHAATHCEACAPSLAGGVPFTAAGGAGALALSSDVPPGIAPQQLLAVAEVAARGLLSGRSDGTLVGTVRDEGGLRRVVAAAARRTSGSGVSVRGLVAPRGSLERVLARAASRESLVPAMLNRGPPLDSALAVTVRTATGEVVFRSGGAGSVGSVFTGAAWLALEDSLLAEVRLAPATTAAVADFVPRARPVLPLLVFILTAIVLILAAVQQRRSADLARQRADFLASVSHDLNTPLALVTVHAETLLKPGVVTGDQRDAFIQVILREARRLSRLVDNALRFTDIGRGPSRISGRPMDLAVVLREAVADFSPLAAARGVTLALTGEVGASVVVGTDRDATRQVLFNLFDNAVKYGPAGQAVSVHAAVVDDVVDVTVDDEGPGIPPRDRERVFGRFVRLGNIDGGAPAGSGIGLSVVRDLCTRMGIAIELANAPSGGTRVTLRFPRGVVGPAGRGAGAERHHAAAAAD